MSMRLPSTKQPDPGALPDESIVEETALPGESVESPPLPPANNPDNMFVCDGVEMEIKPTRLYYQRNGVAAFYRVLKTFPLPYIFQLPDDYFDAKRTPTKCLMDWVSAVVDNPDFTKKHFDNMTSADIYRLLELFLRLNKIEEMEQQVKNLEATAGTKG